MEIENTGWSGRRQITMTHVAVTAIVTIFLIGMSIMVYSTVYGGKYRSIDDCAVRLYVTNFENNPIPADLARSECMELHGMKP